MFPSLYSVRGEVVRELSVCALRMEGAPPLHLAELSVLPSGDQNILWLVEGHHTSLRSLRPNPQSSSVPWHSGSAASHQHAQLRGPCHSSSTVI